MLGTNYYYTLRFLSVMLLFVPFSFYAQKQQAQEGMVPGIKNYTSFSSIEVKNIEEWKKYNLPENYDHPDFGKLPKDAPCQECIELLHERKRDERVFLDIKDPTKYKQQKSLGDINELVNDRWMVIDHSLQASETNEYLSGYNLEQAGFDAQQHKTFIETESGRVYFNDWTLTINTSPEGISLPANWSDFTKGDDGIYVKNIFPGIDAELTVYRGAWKTNFIIKSNLFGDFEELMFTEKVHTPGEFGMQFENGITEGSSSTNFDVFSDGKSLLHVGEPICYVRDGGKEMGTEGLYRTRADGYDLIVSGKWVRQYIDHHQLVIDPLVTGTNTLAQASITGSMYANVAGCVFGTSCNYSLAVPRPANATINDVQWTFSYIAAGACWREDGAIRIATGACLSPSSAGFYWFCGTAPAGQTTGTCTGTNVSIMSDLGSCIPAPGCTPTNVNFTLQFFRDCYGAAGCSGTCIGAGSPWTMTITGQTLAYVNTATPITLSATTICAGGSITASTTGQNGVPGYTYNWSFSPTGTPSVGTGASTGITFPTSGSVTLYSIVTDACGNQVTSSRVVTVTPGPTITVNSPTICAGASATLTATGGTTYTWTPSATLSSGSGNPVTATPGSTTTYTVIGTTSGCSGTATSTVTVTPLPTITVNSPTICTGGSATLTATGGTTYTWTPSATLSSGTGNPVTATPGSTTTYTITGTTSGCSNTATSTVTIVSNPVIVVNSPTICAGSSATLTATGATSYTWTPSATLSSGTGSPVTATPASTTTYTVTGTTGTCSGTATSTVTVTPAPTITVNSSTICNGSSATLTATGGTTYTWTPSATLSSGSGNPVTATPSSTTVYTVTGTTSGCSGTATSTVTVTPLPTITVNSPTICAGSSATLTATGGTTYTWTPSATLSSGTGNPVTATPAGTTTYTVTGTTSGCSNTATSTVTVTPLPTITVNSPTICAGASATLTAAGATSYTWIPSATLSSGSGNPVTATPVATTSYTVTGTDNGCSSTATSTVTVTPLPVITVNSPSICAGSSATLTAAGGTTYSWTPSATLSSASGNPVTATPASTTVYTVTGTSSGCSNTANSTVTVNPIPTISASNNGPLCQGLTLILTGNGQAGSTYSWTGPNAFLSNMQNPQITNVSSVNEGTYTVTVTLNGCTNTATTSFVLTPGAVSTINANGPFCANASPVILSAVNSGGTWSGAGITNPFTGAFDPSLAAVGNNTITYTISGGCGGSSNATVVVNAVPVPSFTASTLAGCSPLNVQFTNTTNPSATSVTWDLGNSTSSTINTPNATYISDGCYTVSLTATDANGCVGTTTYNSFVCVIPDPIAQFQPNSNSQAITDPTFHFINSSVNSVSYLWNFGDNYSSTVTNPDHTYQGQAGSYTVQLIAYNSAGCTDTAHVIITVKEEQIFFIPNTFTPNGDESNNSFDPVFTSGVDPSNFSMVIYNRWGETLFETKNPAIGWDGTYQEKLVPQGVYVWTLRFKDPLSDEKFEFTGNVNVFR